MFFLLYLITGAFAGLVAGLFGLGGGIIIIPVCLIIFPYTEIPPSVIMPVAIATSLASVIITTGIASFVQWQKNNIDFKLIRKALLSLIIAAILGPLLAHHIATAYLKICFAMLLIIITLRMLMTANTIKKEGAMFPPQYQFIPVVFILAFISSLLGLGGGILLLPYIHYCGLSMRQSIGTASFFTFIVGIVATLSYILLGSTLSLEIPQSFGYIYLPAFIAIVLSSFIFAKVGVHLSHRLSPAGLKKIFAIVVFLLAIKTIL